jgi:hypothetical protein
MSDAIQQQTIDPDDNTTVEELTDQFYSSANMGSSSNKSYSCLYTAMKQFQSLQSQRSNVYAEWEQTFRNYIQSKSENELKLYTALSVEVTEKFRNISVGVKQIEAEIQAKELETQFSQDLNAKDMYNLIRTVQLNEKSKLELTIAIQLLQSEYVIHRKTEYDEHYQQELINLRQRLAVIKQNINEALEEIRLEINYS